MGLTKTLLVAGTGAALAYFLDPVSGGDRRRKLQRYWAERVQGEGGGVATDDETGPAVVVPKQPATGAGGK